MLVEGNKLPADLCTTVYSVRRTIDYVAEQTIDRIVYVVTATRRTIAVVSTPGGMLSLSRLPDTGIPSCTPQV